MDLEKRILALMENDARMNPRTMAVMLGIIMVLYKKHGSLKASKVLGE